MNIKNPLLGGIIAAVMIGFSAFRFYGHFKIEEMPTWQLITNSAILIYGLAVAYNVLIKKDAK